jgi:cyclopropane-fatty-acyl-phospholipid synthase
VSQATQLRSVRPAGASRPAMTTTPDSLSRPRPRIDPDHWPDVAVVPKAGLQAVLARRLLTMLAARLPIRVQPHDGPAFGAGRAGSPTLVLHRPGDFYRRVGASGLIGFGESYMAGDWDCDDLTGLLTVLCSRIDTMVPRGFQWLRQLYVARPPADWNADEVGARRNVHQHYDLSNDMFALFLDETMTYSAALFADLDPGSPFAPRGGPGTRVPASPDGIRLADAQRRKIDRLLDLTGVGLGSRVLEIGTGWGELAIRAAARGARVHSITVSAEQRDLARRRVAAAGLAGQATVALQDYREVTGQYDAIVSVEMIEAVAERYWPDYFRALDRLLVPGGRIGIQAITMPHDRMMATRRTKTWILKYIFPGGLIPSVRAIEDNLRHHTALHITDRHEFGLHYAETLRIWRDQFSSTAHQLTRLGFDEVFRRMWLLYLSYSEAGFRARYLQVSQFLLERDERTASWPARR